MTLMPIRRRRSGGYVLIMVLGLLVLSTTLLVAVSCAAGRAVVAARSAQDDLQRRWAVASARKAVLPYVDRVLTTLEQERHRPAVSYNVTVKLGRTSLELILADEQAKANVNAMLAGSDLTRTETQVRQGLSGSGLANRIKLRPTIGPVVIAAPSTRPATQPVVDVSTVTVSALGQVFDNVPAAQLIRPIAGGRAAPLDLMTCWGSGAINLSRAPSAALALAAGRSLSGADIGRLIDARDKLFSAKPSSGFAEASPIDQLKQAMNKAAGEALKNRGNLGLTLNSKCHSLWVITRTGRRDGYDLFVSDQSVEGKPVAWSFSW